MMAASAKMPRIKPAMGDPPMLTVDCKPSIEEDFVRPAITMAIVRKEIRYSMLIMPKTRLKILLTLSFLNARSIKNSVSRIITIPRTKTKNSAMLNTLSVRSFAGRTSG